MKSGVDAKPLSTKFGLLNTWSKRKKMCSTYEHKKGYLFKNGFAQFTYFD